MIKKIFSTRFLVMILGAVCFLTSLNAQAQSNRRFTHDEVHFYLQFESGEATACNHELLKHVPYWRVTCGKRSFTVNTWLQLLHNTIDAKTKVTLMFDVSEGLDSSGERLVQFRSHFTSMVVTDLTVLSELNTDLSVANGQASLNLRAKLDQ